MEDRGGEVEMARGLEKKGWVEVKFGRREEDGGGWRRMR